MNCTIKHIIYHSEETGYTVLVCKTEGYGNNVKVVGYFHHPAVAQELVVNGSWETGKHGLQFAAASIEEALPVTSFGIEQYLKRGIVPGIGPVLAKRLVDQFHEKTLDVMEHNPDALKEVPGIGSGRIQKITEGLKETHGLQNITVFLAGHQVSPALAARIYRRYRGDSVAKIKENPYLLAEEIDGIGFTTADRIAEALGIPKDDPNRIQSGIKYSLLRSTDRGHCFLPREELVKNAGTLLGLSSSQIDTVLNDMCADQSVKEENGAVYLSWLYYAEVRCYNRLRYMIKSKTSTIVPDRVFRRVISADSMTYHDGQLRAIQTAVKSKISIITGGPGTGKTTVVQSIIAAFEASHYDVRLAAPTGRAAKRMEEVTGHSASTLHRMLEATSNGHFNRDESNPIEGDVLIVDECSMIDLSLFDQLLRALPDQMTLVLVGDVNQLPSVGPGNVFSDLIRSKKVPVAYLTYVFRQGNGSQITENAHRILAGQMIKVGSGPASDFFFLPKAKNETLQTVLSLYLQRLPNCYHVNPSCDIQILSPMKKGEAGTIRLNEEIQKARHLTGPELRYGNTVFKKQDKVMNIHNNYEKNVMNGDSGIVTSVNPIDQELTVRFDSREVVYKRIELEDLILAYAITVHKSQGSEYPIVVMPLCMEHYPMLMRNLLYTGVTRAKQILVLVGEEKALARAIKNNEQMRRYTGLANRLAEV